MSPRILALLSGLAVLGCATAARAERPRAVQLEYDLAPGAERCPKEQAFRDVVVARMGFDPFVKDAPARLVVNVQAESGRYRGRAELRNGSRLLWPAEIAPVRDCYNLVRALGLTVAVNLGGSDAAPKVTPSAPDASPAPAAAPPAAAPAPPARAALPLTPIAPSKASRPVRPYRVRLGIGGALAIWAVPADLAFELAADVGLRWPSFSISAETRWIPPAGDDAEHVSGSRFAGAMVPCLHLRWLGICAVGQVGALFGAGSGVVDERHPVLPYVAAGGRLAGEVDLTSRLTARLGADFLTVLVRPQLSIDGRPAWTSPAFSSLVGAGLAASF